MAKAPEVRLYSARELEKFTINEIIFSKFRINNNHASKKC